MKTENLKNQKLFVKAVSAFMIFWLSSVLVFACCGADFFTVFSEEKAESCPLSGGGHECCKKDGDKRKISESKTTLDCCVFKPVKTISADLQNSKETKKSPAVVKKAELPEAKFFAQLKFNPAPVSQSPVPNYKSIYLINCNFRI